MKILQVSENLSPWRGEATLDTKEQSSSTCAAASESAAGSPDELPRCDAAEFKAERDALREELARVRDEAVMQLRHVTTQLEAAELECERRASEIIALKKAESERRRLRRWIEDIEQELCSAQGRIRELESRIEGLSGLNARLSLERAELRARLDSLADDDFGARGAPRATVAMRRRLAELEAELARLIASDALHRESTDEVRSLRSQLETAKSRQKELEDELDRVQEALNASQEAAADKATELDLLRDLLKRSPQEGVGAVVHTDGAARAAAENL